MATATVGPKAYTGDTHAAYGVFPFTADSSTYFVLEGSFPRARFLSVETYKKKKNYTVDALFDAQIEPDPGSVNPVREPEAANPSRRYTIVVAPSSLVVPPGTNVLRLADGEPEAAIWTRYYAPDAGAVFSAADLPRIAAYSVETGAPTACPPMRFENPSSDLPQVLSLLAPRHREPFDFRLFHVPWAGNAAQGKYAYGVSKMARGDVLVVRFRPPTFGLPSEGARDVRYWSLCAINLIKNLGLACLADRDAVPNAAGLVTAVISSANGVREHALARGEHYLPDTRDAANRMVMATLRNLMPSPAFAETEQYQGDFNPRAVICTAEDYLRDECGTGDLDR
jgi:hypothetical protein